MNDVQASLGAHGAAPRARCTDETVDERDSDAFALGAETRLRRLERERDGLRAQVRHLERLARAGFVADGIARDARDLLAAVSATCRLALVEEGAASTGAFEQVRRIAERAACSTEAFLAFVGQGPDPATPSSGRVADPEPLR